MTLKSLLNVAVVAAVVSGSALAQPGDPLIGTWKLNVEKSTGTSFKSGTTKIEAAGDGVKFTDDMAGTDGDVVALTRTDPHTTRITVKQGGKATVTQTIVVSADGKTRTTTTKGNDPNGRPIDSTSVYEKQ